MDLCTIRRSTRGFGEGSRYGVIMSMSFLIKDRNWTLNGRITPYTAIESFNASPRVRSSVDVEAMRWSRSAAKKCRVRALYLIDGCPPLPSRICCRVNNSPSQPSLSLPPTSSAPPSAPTMNLFRLLGASRHLSRVPRRSLSNLPQPISRIWRPSSFFCRR